MSILRNLASAFVPVRERREATGTLAALNAEVVLDVNGDSHCTVSIDGGGATLTATYVIEGSVDGTNYGALLAFPNPQFCLAGTIPLAAQPMALEAVSGTSLRRVVHVACGGLKKVRVRFSLWSAGSATVVMNSDTNDAVNPYIRDQKASTLLVSVTAAAAAGATATLPAVAGLRHYIDRIQIIRSATALLTAGATPTLVTTTNIPGSPVWTFGADAAAQGVDKEQNFDFGSVGMAATALGTATTIIAPATTAVIWRINVSYRLGL